MKTVFTARFLYSPTEEILNPFVVVEDARIVEIASRTSKEMPRQTGKQTPGVRLVEFGDAVLAPGFLDIHIHGGAGVDLMRAPESDLPRLGQFLATHGVTGYFPTTVAAPLDATCAALERLAEAIETSSIEASEVTDAPGGSSAARPLGIHLEGPFLSHKRRGVHPPEYLVEPTLEIFERLWQAARGHVRMMTIAPECPGAIEVIAEAARRKVCVSLGHSDAQLDSAQAGVKAGARHATHTFNAMRPLDHRDPGILAEVLTDNRLTADIVVDGIHVLPAVVRLFMQAKGTDRAVLITDAISAAGMPDGHYQIGPIQVDVKDGKCTSNGSLAGSVLTMDRAIRNVTKFADWTLQNAVRAATANPAQAAGIAGHGILAPGARADFVVLNSQGEVMKTVLGGRL
jgi:N-acetylglucosamine-6-phosphate deacetylase